MALVFNKVTWYSKSLALIFFIIALPAWTFYVGMQYQSTMRDIKDFGEIKPIQEQAVKNQNINETGAVANASASGIAGNVSIGPTCPVEKIDDKSCEPKPYSAKLIITDMGGKIITETVPQSNGKFFLSIQSGTYIIKSADDKKLPRLEPAKVEVLANKIAKISLQFDTGIR